MGTLGKAIYTVGSGSEKPAKPSIASVAAFKATATSKNNVLSRHRTLMNIFDKAPVVDRDAFVVPSASIIGDVQVGRGSSIWYGCVLRGHSAVLHGCTVEDEAFVGMGPILLDGVYVEKHAMVAAGALVRQNTRIPCGEVWGGNPAKFLRKLTEEEMAFISQSALNYSNLAQVHAAENAKTFHEIEFEKVLRKKFARRDEEYDSMLGLKRTRSVPARVFGLSRKFNQELSLPEKSQVKSSSSNKKVTKSTHPLFSLFDARRKKKTTAKPEFARAMPTFTAIALDRLLEPGASISVEKSGPNLKPPIPNPKPIPNSKLERRSSTSVTERKVNCPQISPALYATPEATPLPDSPSSFPPSPYIINHKRRGPRLFKSFSENNVSSREKTLEEGEVSGNAKLAETLSVDLSKDGSVTFSILEPNEEHENGVHNGPFDMEQANGVLGGSIQDDHMNGVHDGEFGSSNGEVGSSQMINGLAMDSAALKVGPLNLERCGDSEDFFDPNESMSVTSNTEGDDDTGAESAARLATPRVEFFDAWDELSSESAPQSILCDAEAELREIRLSLLMEIEKRKQAEEALNKMRCKWQRISKELAVVGLSLPADPVDVTEDELVNPAEELRQQVSVARFVSLSVGRGIARAEMEMEMESQIESKNFEIARLWDRLHYYEAVNREMSQRNLEAVEMARRDRQRKKRRQRWVWGSIAAAITLGTAALAWSYLPTGKGSSSATIPQASDSDDATK
ncbi:hypothetical protein CRYUN_Cryun15aG0137700 [Craigia yunnanensis]